MPPNVQSNSPQDSQPTGKVYLIGAGPGDPGLFTLRGVECLRRADVVLYDYLVNERILSHARDGAERICLGRHGRGRIWPQAEINSQLVALARQGKTVARLKGGDPAVFARGAEEVDALVAAEIRFEVIPGITVALAASSYAGIPITHRDLASAVALVTGHEADKEMSSLDYQALARFPGTLVFYMGVTTARHWVQQLVDAGKAPDTPAAILRHCSLPDQLLLQCTLQEIPERLAAAPLIRPPAIVILGDVVRLASRLSWFAERPLFGKTVLVTRPQQQSEKLARLLEEEGAEVLFQPAIEIGPPAEWGPVDEALQRLSSYNWLIFASSNAVRFLLDRLLVRELDVRALAGPQIACIGPGTAAELERYHLRPALQPDRFQAEDLVAALGPLAKEQRFLLPRGSRGRDVLTDELRAAGGVVDPVVVYQSTDTTTVAPEVRRRLDAGDVDWVTVTSSAIARSVVSLLGPHLAGCSFASISPLTSNALRQVGHEPAVEAAEYTMAGLAAAIRSAK